MIDVTTLAPGTCTSCGHGQRNSYGRCSYCGDTFPEGEHRHHWGARISGLAKCSGRRYLGCPAEDYDSQWGAGMFTDWPRGHSKPFGA